MRERFVSKDFQPPQQAVIGEYTVLPITTDHVVEDWLTLTTNAAAITQQRGGSGSKDEWPYACTLEENYKDLAWLETCAENRQLFSYILRRGGAYAGCIYIYPIELHYPELADKYDVDFSFWITQAEYDAGAYRPVFYALVKWLKVDWPFTEGRIYFRNAELPPDLRPNE